MEPVSERRQQMLEYISGHRYVQMQQLMDEFHISMATAKRDVKVLERFAPIFTVQGNGGGVQAMDGWYASRRYLHNDQEELLRELMAGLQPDDQKTMESILTAFAIPKVIKKSTGIH